LVDGKAIADSGLSIVYNPLFATGQGYLDEFLRMYGCRPTVVNGWRDALFGGEQPDPRLEILEKTTPDFAGCPLLVATDGDADRAAVVESGTRYFGGNENLAIIANYLLERRGMKGTVARTVATSHLPGRVAAGYGQPSVETDVGFKYIGEHLRHGALVGGEESGGISIQGHVPEKDGILTCLLMLEIRAKEGKTLTDYQAALFRRFGPVHDKRDDYHLDPAQKSALFDALGGVDDSFLGRRVAATNFSDGRKFIFEGDEWVLLRPSGTEPVVRVYFECASEESLADMEKRVADFLKRTFEQQPTARS
jgi:phosphomannomutase